jgi:hypothetical protein
VITEDGIKKNVSACTDMLLFSRATTATQIFGAEVDIILNVRACVTRSGLASRNRCYRSGIGATSLEVTDNGPHRRVTAD